MSNGGVSNGGMSNGGARGIWDGELRRQCLSIVKVLLSGDGFEPREAFTSGG